MHVQRAFLNPLPDFLGGKPRAGKVAQGEQREPPCGKNEGGEQSKRAARERQEQLQFPFVHMVVFLGVFEKFHIALDNFWERQLAPAPEFRRRRTGDARDGRGITFCTDNDDFAFNFGERHFTGGAVAFAVQQSAMIPCYVRLCRLKFMTDTGGDFLDIRPAERGNGDFFVGAVNRHRLERGFLGQCVQHCPCKTADGNTCFGWCGCHILTQFSFNQGSRTSPTSKSRLNPQFLEPVVHFLEMKIQRAEFLQFAGLKMLCHRPICV